MGDPSARVLADKLAGQYTAYGKRLDHVSYPRPDQTTAFDALNAPVCGMDSATSDPRGSKCTMPVHCLEGQHADDNCRCTSGSSADAGKLARAGARACASTRCEDGKAPRAGGQGMTCSCAPEPEGGPGRPLPMPVMDTLFGTSDARVNDDASVKVMRSIFDGRARF